MKRINVTRSSMPPFKEYIEEISSLWESRWLTNAGLKHNEFEAMLKKSFKVPNVSLFTNGHLALEYSLEAANLKGKVITTPFTFASTVHAIVRNGLEPVFADVKPDDYTLEPKSIEKLVDESTCAVLPVHVYGNVCDVEAIQDIADCYGLKVIYDAAHAFGVEKEGVSVAAFGDASVFSFHATKVFNTIEGGAVCSKDLKLIEAINLRKNFGIVSPEEIKCIGGNAKMNEFSAAMGICNLRHYDEEIAKRKVIMERYWETLGDIKGIEFYKPPETIKHNYIYMPLVIDNCFGMSRDRVFEELYSQGIGARKYFYPLISDLECYRGHFNSSETPVAKRIAENVLTLPMYADLELSDVDRICKIVKGCTL